jgi:hypothetical protein
MGKLGRSMNNAATGNTAKKSFQDNLLNLWLWGNP